MREMTVRGMVSVEYIYIFFFQRLRGVKYWESWTAFTAQLSFNPSNGVFMRIILFKPFKSFDLYESHRSILLS